MKKFLKVLLAAVICFVFLIALCAGGFFIFYTPSLTADMSVKTGDVTTGASGYLYGIAEEGVPSKNMTESIDISTASQKVADGYQHPIGDISHVYTQLENTDYNVVYLQDVYSTWYYEHDNIEKQRSEGKYDWKKFLENDYLPKVKKAVQYLSSAPYGNKVVYCIYNECDNGVWFGETKENENNTYGVYGEYNSVGEQNFFEAWKITYDFVKSINPNALIGGPGFCDYESSKMENFMTYCVKNDCVPEIMIYHELNDYSVYHWQKHINNYRELENKLGIDELPIIVTEYGRMQDNGLPGKMLQYITQIELTKVYADNAYWRLANNLCDVAADDNSPNSNWWLYRWYADMDGQTVDIKYQDLFKSNFENAFIKRKDDYTSQGFMGIVSITDNEDEIDVICGGRSGSSVVKLKNIDETALAGRKVNVKIEETVYKGISGIVNSPVVLKEYTTVLKGSNLTIDMNDMDEANAYHITITPVSDNEEKDYSNENYIERYEFEEGELLGGAYTYDSAYATTGELSGMVGGMEKEGDGVQLTFKVPEDNKYNLDIIYGNSNDGEFNEEGRQNPDDRVDSTSIMALDGQETTLSLANTIKSEYTDCITLSYELEKGEHTISFKHDAGTIVLDSLLVSTADESESIAFLKDSDRTNESNQSYLAIAPADGYFNVHIVGNDVSKAYVNNQEFSVSDENTVYLMRGLNYIDINTGEKLKDFNITYAKNAEKPLEFYPQNAKLSGGAKTGVNGSEESSIKYLYNISSKGGKAEFNVNVSKTGTYALTLKYANNDENGNHDYNVDLIERYVTVTSGGESQDVYCRNTYSWDTYKTVTCYVHLKAGNNKIAFTNSGSNKFDNRDTYIPYIASFTVSEICV